MNEREAFKTKWTCPDCCVNPCECEYFANGVSLIPEDAKPVASASDEEAFKLWELEEAKTLTVSALVRSAFDYACRHKEAQHKQKVAQLVREFIFNGEHALAHVINKHFGE